MQKSKLQFKIKNWLKIVLITIVIGAVVSILYFKIGLLNQNSGAVIAVFTGVYVIGTLLMWWELRKSRLGFDEPRIQISLVPRKVRFENVIDLVIENVGNVPVIDLKLYFEPNIKNTYGRLLSDVFKEPIKTLSKGKSIKMVLFRSKDISQIKELKIVTEYSSLYNPNLKKKLEFNFDMKNFNFSDMPYEYGKEDLINEIRKIEGNLQGLYHQLDEIKSIMAREEMERNRIKPFEINEK